MSKRNRTWIASDPHLGHTKMAEVREELLAGREHDEAIIDYWNETVRPKDTVWLLGDVVFAPSRNHSLIERLNGLIKLVPGNHDHNLLKKYQHYFRAVLPCMESADLLFTHIPVHPGQLQRWRGNVHGHLHWNKVMIEAAYGSTPDPRYYCVSLEQTELKPVSLEAVVEYYDCMDQALSLS